MLMMRRKAKEKGVGWRPFYSRQGPSCSQRLFREQPMKGARSTSDVLVIDDAEDLQRIRLDVDLVLLST